MDQTADVYIPQWEGTFQNYARSFVRRNAWRVSWRHDWDDCMAIAAEVFSRVRLRCKPLNAKHAMALYKTALAREFHTHALKTRASCEAEAEFGQANLQRQGEVDYNEGQIGLALSGASEELQLVMRTVAQAPRELLEILLEEADDYAWSRRLCRLCRVNLNEGIVSELRQLFIAQGGNDS